MILHGLETEMILHGLDTEMILHGSYDAFVTDTYQGHQVDDTLGQDDGHMSDDMIQMRRCLHRYLV